MADLNAVFSALGDETRRSILQRLMGGEQPLSHLAEPLDMSQTGVTRHVRVLADAGLVNIEKRGRVRHCSLKAEPFREAVSWLETYRSFWDERFDNLARFVAKDEKA